MKYKFHIIVLIIFTLNKVIAQETLDINSKIIQNTFKEFEVPKKTKRSFLKSKKTLVSKINPLTYLSGGLLFIYQNIVSEQIQANCQYQTSCSENMKHQIKHKGLIFGVLSGLNQLGNCLDQVKNDYPDYKISNDDKINNTID